MHLGYHLLPRQECGFNGDAFRSRSPQGVLVTADWKILPPCPDYEAERHDLLQHGILDRGVLEGFCRKELSHARNNCSRITFALAPRNGFVLYDRGFDPHSLGHRGSRGSGPCYPRQASNLGYGDAPAKPKSRTGHRTLLRVGAYSRL